MSATTGKNPFCSMTVTPMVDLRLMGGRLHCHVSAARSPRLATSANASKLGCFKVGLFSERKGIFFNDKPQSVHGFKVLGEPCAEALATVSSRTMRTACLC